MVKVKQKYEVLNKLNLKYGVYGSEIRDTKEAYDFIQSFNSLYGLGKIEEKDYKRGMDSYEQLKEGNTGE